MVRPSKIYPSMQVPLTARQLEAIGLVVVQWSMIEHWMDFQMSAFLAEDIEALTEFRKGSFRERHRQWRDVINVRVHEPWKQELLAIASRIGTIKQDRDRIVHGQWGEEANKGPDPVWLFSWFGTKPNFDWRISYDRLRDAARKIAAENHALCTLLFRISVPPEGTHGTSVREALKRICPPQDRGLEHPSDPPTSYDPAT